MKIKALKKNTFSEKLTKLTFVSNFTVNEFYQWLNLTREAKDFDKKVDDEVLSENCDAIVIFLIYDQLGAMRKPDFGRTVCKTYIFINSNLLFYKKWKQN